MELNVNRKTLIEIAVYFNSVLGLNPILDYNDDTPNQELHKKILIESQHLQVSDIFPDKIIDMIDLLGISHPLKRLRDRPKFELQFIKSNMPEVSRKKLVSREESIVRELKRAWSTMDDWADRSNKFYVEKGGSNNKAQSIKSIKVALRFLIPAGFVETRGTLKNIEYRITTKFHKQQKGE